VYATKKGDCCAVNSLQLTLYENQILALLGKYSSSFLLMRINMFVCVCERKRALLLYAGLESSIYSSDRRDKWKFFNNQGSVRL
jgi:hypothetical protein